MNEQNFNNQTPPQNSKHPGHSNAVGALVCGIIALVFAWFGVSVGISVVAGIVGIVLSVKAKKIGYPGGMATAGMVLSIIGLVLSALVFIACTACISGLAIVGEMGIFSELIEEIFADFMY